MRIATAKLSIDGIIIFVKVSFVFLSEKKPPEGGF
jgi:hypothetical protein